VARQVFGRRLLRRIITVSGYRNHAVNGKAERAGWACIERYGGIMAKFALYAELKAKPGKEVELENFLKLGAVMAKEETGTTSWYAFLEDNGAYGIFDTFDDEAGRDAHLHGEIAKALFAKADELLAEAPRIHRIQILAEKD
jgi:quinol monooxygenase YgiN